MTNVKFEIYTKATDLFKGAKQKTVTPTELQNTLGKEAPASKHAWFLKSLGFTLQANKDGRNVVSYTLLSAPAKAPEVKVAAVKVAKKPKVAKVAKAKTTKTTVAKKAPATTGASVAAAKKPTKKSPTARKANVTAATPEPVMTEAELTSAAAGVDIADVNELDDRSDLPEHLR